MSASAACGASVATGTRFSSSCPRLITETDTDLNDGICSPPAELSGQWVVLRVLTKQEIRVARGLSAAGIGVYVPAQQVRRRESNGRSRPPVWRTTEQPLFPGYVFACIANSRQWNSIWRQHAVFDLLHVKLQQQFVREIQAIYTVLSTGNPLTQISDRFLGKRVRIIRGPWMGTEGFAERVDGKLRLQLRITTLGQSVVLEHVEPDTVELLD